MADLRQMTRVTGLKAHPYTNLHPLRNVIQRYGRFDSGAYDAALAQDVSPILARLGMFRRKGAVEDAFRDWAAKREREGIQDQMKMQGLRMAGGISSDLADWFASRRKEPMGEPSPALYTELMRLMPEARRSFPGTRAQGTVNLVNQGKWIQGLLRGMTPEQLARMLSASRGGR